MRPRIALLVMFALGVWGSDVAEAQTHRAHAGRAGGANVPRSAGRTGMGGIRADNLPGRVSSYRKPGLRGTAPGRGALLGTFDSRRYGGIDTRVGQLRKQMLIGRPNEGLLPSVPTFITPTQRLQDRRNLLRSRSPLGAKATVLLGRSQVVQSEGAAAEPISPAAASQSAGTPGTSQPASEQEASRQFSAMIEDRLLDQAARNFELGCSAYRSGNFLRAHHYFDLTREVWRDNPQPYVGAAMASFNLQDYHVAMADLVRAIDRAEKIEDLRIDGFLERFYPGETLEQRRGAFDREMESVNMFVKNQTQTSRPHLLLAFYAWLGGDLETAVSAVELAVPAFDEAKMGQAGRFRDWLAAAQEPPGAAAP